MCDSNEDNLSMREKNQAQLFAGRTTKLVTPAETPPLEFYGDDDIVMPVTENDL